MGFTFLWICSATSSESEDDKKMSKTADNSKDKDESGLGMIIRYLNHDQRVGSVTHGEHRWHIIPL